MKVAMAPMSNVAAMAVKADFTPDPRFMLLISQLVGGTR